MPAPDIPARHGRSSPQYHPSHAHAHSTEPRSQMAYNPTDHDHDQDDSHDPEDYYLAPQHQRPFNAGIKRKRIEFIPASDATTDISFLPITTSKPSDTAAKYLSIVLGPRSESSDPKRNVSDDLAGRSTLSDTPTPNPILDSPSILCPICNEPLQPGVSPAVHESSITHQIALEHSHPPSHLDRQRKGLKYLEGYGWDPDSRLGLGARSEGIRVPVRAVEKRNTAGLGLFSRTQEDDEDGGGKKANRTKVVEEDVGPKLNAKQMRRLDEQKKKRAEKLRGMFYGEDLSKYLGEDG